MNLTSRAFVTEGTGVFQTIHGLYHPRSQGALIRVECLGPSRFLVIVAPKDHGSELRAMTEDGNQNQNANFEADADVAISSEWFRKKDAH